MRLRPIGWLPRISMGPTLAQLSQRLRCAECRGALVELTFDAVLSHKDLLPLLLVALLAQPVGHSWLGAISGPMPVR